MKPVSIKFKAFGPFVKEQKIDFSDLDRIFAICGETGAGKTTILDAMCYALYGSSSSGDRGEFSDMRCQQAGDEDDTIVEFVFEENGKTYRFIRKYAKARTKFNEEYFCDEKLGGEWKPLAANPKKTTMQEMAENILHLNATQFRQIIILPQGKFESFLVSDSKAKEEVLESIFNASQWGVIAQKVMDTVTKEDSNLKEKELHVKEILQRYGCLTEEDMRAQKDEKASELAEKEKELEKATEDSGNIQNELEDALKDDALFSDLDNLKTKRTGLEQRREKMEENKRKLNLASEAEKISSGYNSYKNAKDAEETAESRKAGAETGLETAQKNLDDAGKKSERHAEGKTEQEERNKRKTLLEKARSDYESIGEYRRKCEEAVTAYGTAEEAVKKARTAFDDAREARNQAIEEHEKLHKKYTADLGIYRIGIAGELAAQLQEDQPCPVCGSMHHPAPAVYSADHVSKEDLEKIEKDLEGKKKSWKTAEETLKTIEQNLKDAEQKYSNAKETRAGAEAALKEAEKNLIEGIADSDGLENEISNMTEKIGLYDNLSSEIEEELKNANAVYRSASDALNTAKDDCTKAKEKRVYAEKVWIKTLGESAFGTEEEFLQSCMDTEKMMELSGQLTAYKTNLESVQKQITEKESLCNGRERPDINGIKERQKEINDQIRNLTSECDGMRNFIKAMAGDLEEYTSKHPVLLRERAELEKDKLFAERLRGDRGISIKRYVLGIMMTMIVQQANTFLANIYGGRYRLHKKESEAQNKKVGLDLEAEDLQTGESRGVSSLSGGEKFLVALSLAIGLSSVVQMQGKGVNMDAMFVDEGFGSLHANAVEDAISILAQARGGNGIVGVITHVDQVVKSIGVGLEAVKGTNGNSIRNMSELGLT